VSASNLSIFREALAWRHAGRAVALACVVETWGSAPRPPGSRLVVDADGNFSGSVSAAALFAAVRLLEGDKGARDLIAARQENILELPIGDSAIEIDVDTWEDLRRHCHIAE
jgi:xanthine/CO dehydrogenase XdhC/CoxF family maturation factor